MVSITAPPERVLGYKIKGVCLSRKADAFVQPGQMPRTSSCKAKLQNNRFQPFVNDFPTAGLPHPFDQLPAGYLMASIGPLTKHAPTSFWSVENRWHPGSERGFEAFPAPSHYKRGRELFRRFPHADPLHFL